MALKVHVFSEPIIWRSAGMQSHRVADLFNFPSALSFSSQWILFYFSPPSAFLVKSLGQRQVGASVCTVFSASAEDSCRGGTCTQDGGALETCIVQMRRKGMGREGRGRERGKSIRKTKGFHGRKGLLGFSKKELFEACCPWEPYIHDSFFCRQTLAWSSGCVLP